MCSQKAPNTPPYTLSEEEQSLNCLFQDLLGVDEEATVKEDITITEKTNSIDWFQNENNHPLLKLSREVYIVALHLSSKEPILTLNLLKISHSLHELYLSYCLSQIQPSTSRSDKDFSNNGTSEKVSEPPPDTQLNERSKSFLVNNEITVQNVFLKAQKPMKIVPISTESHQLDLQVEIGEGTIFILDAVHSQSPSQNQKDVLSSCDNVILSPNELPSSNQELMDENLMTHESVTTRERHCTTPTTTQNYFAALPLQNNTAETNSFPSVSVPLLGKSRFVDSMIPPKKKPKESSGKKISQLMKKGKRTKQHPNYLTSPDSLT